MAKLEQLQANEIKLLLRILASEGQLLIDKKSGLAKCAVATHTDSKTGETYFILSELPEQKLGKG